MRTVTVSLGNRSYAIRIGRALIDRLGKECEALGLGRRCVLITDANVARHYFEPARIALATAGFSVEAIVLPPGESTKNLRTVQACYNRLSRARLERSSFVVALGGGVIGDLAGFVAATYLRGISFVQVPTTLLAQVDSSIGGKVGVNLASGKNLVGAFHQPRLVLADVDALKTLSDREFRAGLAEVIKYGIIFDSDLFERIERVLPRIMMRDPRVIAEIVARCCEIKASVVSKDETEGGLRAILNFGHTIGHALEAMGRYRKYLHGEAIAIGQVAAARVSSRLLGLPESDADRICHLFERVGLPTKSPLSARQLRRVLEIMSLDKKVAGGNVRFVLVRRIGEAVYGQRVPENVLVESLKQQTGALSKS
ncbi:MAG TPA: 3-dehydroquinate synthase [Verrucomicrobiota bacterium]|nr:3-dehydroquinate synthase [Verrucomicrobiota bacterium]